MDNYEAVKLRKKINRLAARGCLAGRCIVLFGASAASKEIKKALFEKGLRPCAVIDNDERRIGRECLGLVVRSPESVLTPFNDAFAVLICSAGFYREMTFQLQKLGYAVNRHIFWLNFRSDERISVFLYNLARMARGWLTYRRLTKKYSEEHTIFLAPYTGTGDVYLAGLFFEAYLKKNGIAQYVFVVVSGACRKVAEMFGIENIETVSRLAVDDIINCNRAFRAGWSVVMLNDGWMGEITQWIRGYRDLSFDKMFRYFVFGLDDSVSYRLPTPAGHGAEIEALFKKHGLKKNKTVVLSPYSNTLFEPPADLWEEIVDCCKARGYTVCTNSAGPDEPPIESTIPVFFPLGSAIEFMNAAGYFVGVRSGLCDIISSSSCKKVILYEKDGFFYKCSPFDYFSLKKMRLCDDALELAYRSDAKQEILNRIKAIF